MSFLNLLPRTLLVAALPFVGGGSPGEDLTGSLTEVPELEEGLPAVEQSRVERFVLEWRSEGEMPASSQRGIHTARRAKVLGLASMRRRSDGTELQLEVEFDFLLEDLRVYCVERSGEFGLRMIWREMAERRGRTIRVERSRDGSRLDTAEWDKGGRRGRTSSLEEGGVMPQYLLELAREGRVLSGSFRVFDPLGGGLETLELATTYETDSEEVLARVVRLTRPDGTLAGEYHFRGEVLTSFQLQNGRVRARAVDEEGFLEARKLYHAGLADGVESGSTESGS